MTCTYTVDLSPQSPLTVQCDRPAVAEYDVRPDGQTTVAIVRRCAYHDMATKDRFNRKVGGLRARRAL